MTTQTEAERLADGLERHPSDDVELVRAAAELRRLVSFNQQLMDEVARLTKAVADERGACAKVCDTHTVDDVLVGVGIAQSCAAVIRERGNT